MPDSYDFVTLMCRLKAAQNEVEDFKSGEKYEASGMIVGRIPDL